VKKYRRFFKKGAKCPPSVPETTKKPLLPKSLRALTPFETVEEFWMAMKEERYSDAAKYLDVTFSEGLMQAYRQKNPKSIEQALFYDSESKRIKRNDERIENIEIYVEKELIEDTHVRSSAKEAKLLGCRSYGVDISAKALSCAWSERTEEEFVECADELGWNEDAKRCVGEYRELVKSPEELQKYMVGTDDFKKLKKEKMEQVSDRYSTIKRWSEKDGKPLEYETVTIFYTETWKNEDGTVGMDPKAAQLIKIDGKWKILSPMNQLRR